MKRRSMSGKQSRRAFSKGNRTHKKNNMGTIMRGGYRL